MRMKTRIFVNRDLGTDTGERATAAQKGFTLVELSIVLVIIGLIIGGVLILLNI